VLAHQGFGVASRDEQPSTAHVEPGSCPPRSHGAQATGRERLLGSIR
jgi:hypothetical protein